MTKRNIRTIFASSACAAALLSVAHATEFNVPSGDLESALNQYTAQSGVPLAVSYDAIKSIKTKGVAGNLSPDDALSRILKGTGLIGRRDAAGVIQIVPGYSPSSNAAEISPLQMAQAAPPRAAVETVTVTSSKLGGADVQSIPIAITALSQEQLTATQTAGGPDLVKQVPNLTFTKTNFTGYSIQIRGIGTQAISVTTDPAVAVAFNDTPFIRNHFFEQEFYDVSQVEVLRGPQGTLYGRNATAGVVNLVSAKPTDQFEALASADIGNYHNRRFEGMVNLAVVDDELDIRLAGEWTKRQGYSTNLLTGNSIDGRDLWSSRLTIGWKPLQNLQAYLVWEHFSEDDDRMRTAKQLCKTDRGPQNIGNVNVRQANTVGDGIGLAFTVTNANLSQGCLPTSLYSPDAFQVPYGYALPYVTAGYVSGAMNATIDPYASTVQSPDLRVIETQIDPVYKAKNDTVELNADYNLTPSVTLTSQTGYNQDSLWSTEDYNRFNTSPGIFQPPLVTNGVPRLQTLITPDGEFCDPQLGCSNRLVAQDISRERAWQLSQEFRLATKFSGPFNFSAGGNYMHYETVEDYYVFANSLTLFAATSGIGNAMPAWQAGISDNHECLSIAAHNVNTGHGPQYNDPNAGAGQPTSVCYAIDPSPLQLVDDAGHNYFLSRNPYTLNSYAFFGETYYDVFQDLKLTGGLRWTSDHKRFVDIPSELLAQGYGYASIGDVDQEWKKFTGRFAVNWTPKLNFTDQTLLYGSYARGYKAGGANPPGAVLSGYSVSTEGVPVHPLTFEPEYIDAFELGTKNTLFDGALTLNGNVFYYNYRGYQISEIVDRTSINLNFDATVKGAEVEASYEPVPGLRFRFAGGYEHTRLADGSQSVDLMDRTAGHPGWVVMKPFVTLPSNCIFPDYVVQALIVGYASNGEGNPAVSACTIAYNKGYDPATFYGFTGYTYQYGVAHGFYPEIYTAPGQPTITYPGFDPVSPDATNNGYGPAPNGGAGFSKDLSGNELPNAPPFTVSFSAEYTLPLTEEWAGTLRGDYYWQDYSWARVFNDKPYDRLRGYTNVNLALILTSQNGWQAMGYIKNVFNTTDITGAFLNSDDSGLTTNVFLTDPRLFGVRVTKNW